MLSSKANYRYAIFALLIVLTATMSAKTRVARQAFGHTSGGTLVDLYSLADGKVEVRIMTYGGIIVSLRAPDRKGKLEDVVLGCDSVEKYVAQTAHFGGIIGRYANRIAHGRRRNWDRRDGGRAHPAAACPTWLHHAAIRGRSAAGAGCVHPKHS